MMSMFYHLQKTLWSVFITAVTIIVITSCSSDATQSTGSNRDTSPQVIFAYPFHGQKDVAIGTPITLKLSTGIKAETAAAFFKVWDDEVKVEERNENNAIAGEIEIDAEDPSVLRFKPDHVFAQGKTYHYVFDGLQTTDDVGLSIETAIGSVSFETRNDFNPDFEIEQIFPSGEFPLMDFSSIYIRLSRNAALSTLSYGNSDDNTVVLLDDQGAAVPATLLTGNRYLTLDPTDDLVPGKTYTLKIHQGIRDQAGNELPPTQFQLSPQDSQPRAQQTLLITPTAYPESEGDTPLSPIAGKPVNTAVFASPLLGDNNPVKVGGSLNAELAYLPRYPDISPFVLRKGTIIKTTPLDVKMGGAVPGKIDSGEITMTLTADSIGYMFDNPFTTDKYANRNIMMFMDAALQTTAPVSNSMLTQNVLQSVLSGIVQVKNGKMMIDAVGFVEGSLIRISNADANIVFHFESVEDPLPVDNTVQALTLLSSYPLPDENSVNPDNDFTFFLSSAIDPNSVKPHSNVKLERIDGNSNLREVVDFEWYTSGSALYIAPRKPLPFNQQFEVTLSSGLSDMRGNTIQEPIIVAFSTPAFSPEKPKPAMVKAVYPGFPCALTDSDYPANIAGRCLGGFAEDYRRETFSVVDPSRKPIKLWFSKALNSKLIDKSDQCNEGNFRVEKIDDNGNCVEAVAGSFEYQRHRLIFTPQKPWFDESDVGKIDRKRYRYIINTADMPGNIKVSDEMFGFFHMPANRAITLWFTQPIDPASISKSANCGEGSFRVESIDENGNCLESIAGELMVKHQKITFRPIKAWERWEPDRNVRYRWVLNSSDENKICDAGEVCSQSDNPLPLNTDPLNFTFGILGKKAHDDIGGPPMEMPFIGVEESYSVMTPLSTTPYTDVNSNGFFEKDKEVPRPKNSMTMKATYSNGTIKAPSIGCDFFKPEQCDEWSNSTFSDHIEVVEILDYQDDLPIVGLEEEYEQYKGGIEVLVHPMVNFGTSVKIFSYAVVLPIELQTGMMMVRTEGVDGGPMRGRLVPGGSNHDGKDENGEPVAPLFQIPVRAVLDAPYLNILDGIIETNMHSLAFDIVLEGPQDISPDGRIYLDLSNKKPVYLTTKMYLLQKDVLEVIYQGHPKKDTYVTLLDDMLTNIFYGEHFVGSMTITVPAGGISYHLIGETPQ